MEYGKSTLEIMAVDFWRDRNVFVTGATGLLGSWLIEELLRLGSNVTCLVRDWVAGSRLFREGYLEKTNVVRGELEDYFVLLRTINEYEINTVFHLGAQTIVGTSSRSAISTFDSNILGTWNLLEACKVCSGLIERVIVASSDKAYGMHEILPYVEDTPLQGRYPYDVSKTCADLIATSYHHTFQVPLAITRCGNLFGGGDLNFNRLIPGTIRSLIKEEAPIIRSDGTYVRDYFYVKDAVSAFLQLAQKLHEPEITGQAFNFGNENPRTVLEIVELLSGIMEKPELLPIILNEATHEIPKQYLSCVKAKQILGWSPSYNISKALEETVDWYKDYFASQ